MIDKPLNTQNHKIATIHTIIPVGPDGALVKIESDASEGLPTFNLVGLASKTVNESRERVRSALRSSGFKFPAKHLTVSLAPAELDKDGPHLDLPIALSILILTSQLSQNDVKNAVFVGELSLEGHVRPVRGIINIVEVAKKLGYKSVYIPIKNLEAASLIQGIKIYGVNTLSELFEHLKGQACLSVKRPNDQVCLSVKHLGDQACLSTERSNNQIYPSTKHSTTSQPESHPDITFSDIQGQARAKRALAIAIAGRHNILLEGPPGAGKTALAKAATSLLPPLTNQEQISVTKLHSLREPQDDIIKQPPFRSPHHTASPAAIIGSGGKQNHIFPGEISLAHDGILFLDELPEFPRNVLEALRQPLEDHQITISRANQKTTYPADFMLIAAMNPCPCGHLGDKNHRCICTDFQIQNYQKRISGPLLDRIDLYIEVKRENTGNILNNPPNTNTEYNSLVRSLETAFGRQAARHKRNARLTVIDLREHANLGRRARALLETAADKLSLSARSYLKTLRVARTIADLEDENQILESHISEALSFRKPIKPL